MICLAGREKQRCVADTRHSLSRPQTLVGLSICKAALPAAIYGRHTSVCSSWDRRRFGRAMFHHERTELECHLHSAAVDLQHSNHVADRHFARCYPQTSISLHLEHHHDGIASHHQMTSLAVVRELQPSLWLDLWRSSW